jgi:hypothetical protein
MLLLYGFDEVRK